MTKSEISERWPNQAESFDEAVYELITRHGNIHQAFSSNYYSWIASRLTPFLGRRTMELGAGMGMLTKQISPAFECYIATDGYEAYLEELRKVAEGCQGYECSLVDAATMTGAEAALQGRRLDSIFSSNMLEHIEDDVTALKNMADVVGKGGRVVKFVPALRRLYGPNDQAVGHFRRYERDELVEKMKAAGMEVEHAEYFNFPGKVAWNILNRGPQQGNVGQQSVALFNLFVPVFRLMELVVRPPSGLSLIVVGRVPDSQ